MSLDDYCFIYKLYLYAYFIKFYKGTSFISFFFALYIKKYTIIDKSINNKKATQEWDDFNLEH